MQRALAFVVVALALHAQAHEDSVTYGPNHCVSLSRSAQGSCVLRTDCYGVDLSHFEFVFDCTSAGGEIQRHSFGVGGFDPEEEFDTNVTCGLCTAPVALPDEGSGVAQMVASDSEAAAVQHEGHADEEEKDDKKDKKDKKGKKGKKDDEKEDDKDEKDAESEDEKKQYSAKEEDEMLKDVGVMANEIGGVKDKMLKIEEKVKKLGGDVGEDIKEDKEKEKDDEKEDDKDEKDKKKKDDEEEDDKKDEKDDDKKSKKESKKSFFYADTVPTSLSDDGVDDEVSFRSLRKQKSHRHHHRHHQI